MQKMMRQVFMRQRILSEASRDSLFRNLYVRLSASSAALKEVSPVPPKLLVLRYWLVDGMLEKRAPYRSEHLSNAAKHDGLIAAGAFSDPLDQSMFLFKGDTSIESIEEFAQNDPYFKAGLVTGFEVRPWSIAIDKSRSLV